MKKLKIRDKGTNEVFEITVSDNPTEAEIEKAAQKYQDSQASNILAAERQKAAEAARTGKVKQLTPEQVKAAGQADQASIDREIARLGGETPPPSSIPTPPASAGMPVIEDNQLSLVPADNNTVEDVEEKDTSGATRGERFLGGMLGGGAGVVSAATQGVVGNRDAAAVKRAGLEETARINAQRAAATSGALPAGANMQQPTGLTSGEKWASKTGYGKGQGTVQDVSSRYQRSMGQGPVSGRMDKLWGPPLEGESQQLSQRLIDRAKALELSKAPPPKLSGLDAVTEVFKDMIRPIGTAAGTAIKTVGKYGIPIVSGIGAGVDAMELAHEYQKPEEDRDYGKMINKGVGLAGGALSMFPPTMPLGAAMSLGSAAYNNRKYLQDKYYEIMLNGELKPNLGSRSRMSDYD
jgi:hypothetical protein